MKVEDLIRFSLHKTKIERLIVLLGFMEGCGPSNSQGKHGAHLSSSCFLPRASVACRLEDYIFRNCRPSLNDIHDPERCRFTARDGKGEGRAYYHAYTQAQKQRHRRRAIDDAPGRHGGRESLRRPQQWDSAPVPDFMGVWCDRLLLGDERSPMRTALLRPYVPPLFQPQAIQQVGRSHGTLRAPEVLLVDTTPALPVGILRLGKLSQHRKRVPQWVGPSVERRWGDRISFSDKEICGLKDLCAGKRSGEGLEEKRRHNTEHSIVDNSPRPFEKAPRSQQPPRKEMVKREERKKLNNTFRDASVYSLTGCCLSMDDAFQHFCSRSSPSPSSVPSSVVSFPSTTNAATPHVPSSQDMDKEPSHLTTSSSGSRCRSRKETESTSSRMGTNPPPPSQENEEPFVLAIGCGPAHIPPGAPLTAEEENRMREYVLPLAAFTTALWTVNPRIASEYVTKQTPLPSASPSEAPPPLSSVPPNYRLWGTMQDSMLSTRDTALLRAYFSNTSLDKRLSMFHQTYLAETLLRRLEEYERDSW